MIIDTVHFPSQYYYYIECIISLLVYLKYFPFVQSSSPNVGSVVNSHDPSPHITAQSKYRQTSKNQQTP